MKTKLLALALLALTASAQTFTCVGCTDFGPIAGTPYTMQYGAKMVWTANVEPGVYVVDLTFVEPVYTTKAQRPLNVWVNDAQVLFGFDVIGASGPFLPYIYSRVAIVSGGKIVVTLTASDTGTIVKTKHSAILSAISAAKLPTGGGSSPPIQQAACQLTRTSPTLLTMSACPILVSNVFYMVAGGTIGVSGGNGAVRVGIDLSTSTPAGRVIGSAQVLATCAGLGGCTEAQTGEQFADGDLPVGIWSVTNGQFDANGYTPLIATIQGFRLESVGGLVQTQSGHKVQIRVNTDVMPVQ